MLTPVFDFVKKYADSDFLRLHMPGHKGCGDLGCEGLDITEIDGADVLYNANGIIKQSENITSQLFGTAQTFFSTEGSSLGIRSMLYMIKMYAISKGEKPLVFAGRNAHKTFITACALLDIDVKWLLPTNADNVISCNITDEFLEEYLAHAAEKPTAVYITTPDYLGNILDIQALSNVCKKHGVLLVADNAHGAYLKFLPDDFHPITLGADICCDSAHKTLPVLTGGGYIHISNNAPELFSEYAEQAMSLFASTSPSYLILASLDRANRHLGSGYKERLAEFANRVKYLKKQISDIGFSVLGNEPLKITVAPKKFGYTGYELAEKLKENKIICEFADPDFVVMMLTPEIGDEELEKVSKVFSDIKRRRTLCESAPTPSLKKTQLTLHEALSMQSEIISVKDSVGRIAADISVNCPPAVPITICGEEIDQIAVKSFLYYGIETVRVIKEKNR